MKSVEITFPKKTNVNLVYSIILIVVHQLCAKQTKQPIVGGGAVQGVQTEKVNSNRFLLE